MTRAERLAQQEARTKARLEIQRKQLARVQTQRKAEAQKARRQRAQLVGRMVLETPLATRDDVTLMQLFAVLARLADRPDPVAVLDSLLDPQLSGPLIPGNGYAQAAPGVSTAC